MIENSQQRIEKQFSSDFKKEIEDENSESNPDNDKQLLNKITNTSSNNLNSCKNTDIKKLCDPYIESKNTKIIKYKKMTLITCKL